MKNVFLIILFVAGISTELSAQETPANPSYIYKKADTEPEFSGGTMAFVKYVREKLTPGAVKDTLTLMATFVVEKDGAVSGLRFMNRKPFPRELSNIIRESPSWTPATIKGKPVRFQVVMPLRLIPKN